jgi:N-acetylglucosaminyldiphosphoundecaprenol N-acetyl-beta-D-mannosaminyltransferase
VTIGSVAFDALTAGQAAAHVRDGMARGRGGRVLVVAHDQLRQVEERAGLRQTLAGADLVLAGSATAVWASRVSGTPLPERVTGLALVDALCAVCATDRRRVFLVGGLPGGPGVPSGAQRAAAVLGLRHQGLLVAGCAAPTGDLAIDAVALDRVVSDVVDAQPDLVLIGVDGSGPEEALIAALRDEWPDGWLFGCPDIIGDVVGDPGPRDRGRAVSYSARLLARAAAARVRPRR